MNDVFKFMLGTCPEDPEMELLFWLLKRLGSPDEMVTMLRDWFQTGKPPADWPASPESRSTTGHFEDFKGAFRMVPEEDYFGATGSLSMTCGNMFRQTATAPTQRRGSKSRIRESESFGDSTNMALMTSQSSMWMTLKKKRLR